MTLMMTAMMMMNWRMMTSTITTGRMMTRMIKMMVIERGREKERL